MPIMSDPQVCIMVGSALFSILSQRGLSEATILKVAVIVIVIVVVIVIVIVIDIVIVIVIFIVIVVLIFITIAITTISRTAC